MAKSLRHVSFLRHIDDLVDAPIYFIHNLIMANRLEKKFNERS